MILPSSSRRQSGDIIKNSKGEIVFDLGMLMGIMSGGQGTDWEDLIKRHPLYNNDYRQRKLRALNENPDFNKKLNPRNENVNKALKEFEKVMEYNQRLLDKGYDPNDPKDRAQFKTLSKERIALAFSAFGGKRII